jgi:hypothetical protein
VVWYLVSGVGQASPDVIQVRQNLVLLS